MKFAQRNEAAVASWLQNICSATISLTVYDAIKECLYRNEVAASQENGGNCFV